MLAQPVTRPIEIPVVISCAALPRNHTLRIRWTVVGNFLKPTPGTIQGTSIPLEPYLGKDGRKDLETVVVQEGEPLELANGMAILDYLKLDPRMAFTLYVDPSRFHGSLGCLFLNFSGEYSEMDDKGKVVFTGKSEFLCDLMRPSQAGVDAFLNLSRRGKGNDLIMTCYPTRKMRQAEEPWE
jgi:hypothetical protein